MNEALPIGGIVDADTFGYYVIGYMSRLADNPPRKIVLPSQFPAALTQAIREEFQEKEEVEFVIPSRIYLEGCPWTNTPAALQKVIGEQYDAARLNEDKTVNMRIQRSELLFTLVSPSVKRDIDTFGENLVYQGVSLALADSISTKKGSWFIVKQNAVLKGKRDDLLLLHRKIQEGESFSPEEQSLWKKLTAGAYKRPASLPELHAVAEFMERFKNLAAVQVFE
ncbi:MAG: hypothetical protein M1372_02755 [Patescibacteria group bacterium]|nr:hypothetical protein [Patescibacteria group bacterium]